MPINPVAHMIQCPVDGIYFTPQAGGLCPLCEAKAIIDKVRLMIPEDQTLEEVLRMFDDDNPAYEDEELSGEVGGTIPDAEESLGEETDKVLEEAKNDETEIDEASKENEEGAGGE